MKEAKINSITLYNYSKPELYVSVTAESGVTTFTLKDADVDQVQTLLWQIIERKKHEMAESILAIQTPVALQDFREFPQAKTLDDEIPF